VLTVHVLGPVEVRGEGQPVELGGPQQRAVIAHLALEVGRVVSVERLVDRLWGDDPPRTPLGTLQSYVSRLRRALEPDRIAGAAPRILVSEAPGYVLRLPEDQIDVHRFRGLVTAARASGDAARHQTALEQFDEALALWRGPAFGGVGPDDLVHAIVVGLDGERESAIEDRFEVLLALGRHAEAASGLQAAIGEQPLRERLWALLALALYRSSRQADALRALSTARSMLLDELGLDPGPELRELESRILAQDSTLLLAAPQGHAPLPVVQEQSAPLPRAELVERSEEWRALIAALAAARSGTPQLVLIEGDPGIGKSTLCDAFVTYASTVGWSTAIGRCVEPGLAPSLWPCIEIVRAMIADSPTVADAIDATASPLLRLVTSGANSGVSLAPVEMVDHFIALLDELGNRPWVIMVDDLHWGDRATLDVVRLVLERLGSRPVVVVGAHRPPEIVPESLLGDALGDLRRTSAETSRIQMSPLDTIGVARLMEITTGVTPSDELADRVRARTGGNPLFVSELARLAGERGLSDDSVVPNAIRDVVRGRLSRLPDRATAELEVAAVLGERFDLRTAMAASERDPDSCLDALDSAIVTRILVPEGDGFRFTHALVRDAVLAEIPFLRLARLHHRAAEAILFTRGDGPDEAEPIAYHRLASASFTDPVVVAKAAVRASDVARWRNALDTADRLADQALDVLAGVPRTPQVSAIEVEALEAIIGAAYRRNDPTAVDEVRARVERFADRTGSDAARALGLFINWGEIDETEDLSDLVPSVDRVRALATRTTDSYAVVTSRFMLASYSWLTGRIDEAAEHADIAIAASGASHPDARPEHVPLVLLPMVAGIIAALQGDADRAREHSYRRAAAWLSQRSEVDATAHVALAFSRALVEALLGEARAVLDELGDAPRTDEAGFVDQQIAMSELLTGWAHARLGNKEGLNQAFAAMAAIDRSAEHILRACLRSFLADTCLAVSDPRAIALLDQSRVEAESRGELWWLPEIIRLRAEADLRLGDGNLAPQLLDEAETLAASQGSHIVLPRIAVMRDLVS
jgi:DNA-binding SARP family transcriptional activator